MKKILILEDEKPMAKALCLKFQKAGYEVDLAGDGEEALKLACEKKYDLILSDLIVPKMDGFGLLAELKKKQIETPVFVASNLSQAEDEKRVMALGAKGYFVKSNIAIADIVSKVESFLGSNGS